MSLKNLALDVESIALCLSEEGGYEYYDIDDDLKELAKNVSDMEAENSKLRELTLGLKWCSENYGCENSCPLYDKSEPEHCREERLLRELGMEVDE